MKHIGTKTIQTKRLILRPFVDEDYRSMFENWCSDEVTRYMTWSAPKTLEEAEKLMSGWTKRYCNDNFYHWAIVPEGSEHQIGFISVISCDENVEKVELGYCIGKDWWHKGIMTEALSAVIEFLFNQVGVKRIQACHDTNNINSGKVMKKCGMQYEGTLRRYEKTNNGICDIAYYSILAEEFK